MLRATLPSDGDFVKMTVNNWFLERRERERYSTRTEQKFEAEVATTYNDLEGKAPKPATPDEARRMAEKSGDAWE